MMKNCQNNLIFPIVLHRLQCLQSDNTYTKCSSDKVTKHITLILSSIHEYMNKQFASTDVMIIIIVHQFVPLGYGLHSSIPLKSLKHYTPYSNQAKIRLNLIPSFD